MAKKKIESTEKLVDKELPIVEYLESRAKCGFRTEVQNDNDYAEPLFKLVCDDRDPDAPAVSCTPWCTAQVLSSWIQGALFLSPLLSKLINKYHENAPAPEAEKEVTK